MREKQACHPQHRLLFSSHSSKATATFDAEGKYFQCIKAGLLAHMAGSAPAVSVEFARKALLSSDRPTFAEVEDACAALPPVN